MIKIIILFFLSQGALSKNYVNLQNGLTIVSAKRDVQLTTQIVKVKLQYELKNKGSRELNYFVHAFSSSEASNLAWFFASEEKKLTSSNLYTQVEIKDAPTGFVFYKIELLTLLAVGESITLNVEYYLTSYLNPYPAEINQIDSQFILYKGFANILSAFPIEKESSNFKIGYNKVISYTEQKPSQKLADKIVYGPYLNQQPFVKKAVIIHYENNFPFVVMAFVNRIIEVSHWGVISIEEHVKIVNKGAKLKGSFSRLDYQLSRFDNNKHPVFEKFKRYLPVGSTNIYFRDLIGNVSTSTINKYSNRVEVELEPRFPLFGGWQTDYVFGYSISTKNFLFSKGSQFELKIPVIDGVDSDWIIENLNLKIILPETCKNIMITYPYAMKRLPDEIHKTYLDIAGRPVIVLEKKNVIDRLVKPLQVHYQFDRIYLLREPLIAILALLTLFIVIIVFLRLDFTISSKESNCCSSIINKKDN